MFVQVKYLRKGHTYSIIHFSSVTFRQSEKGKGWGGGGLQGEGGKWGDTNVYERQGFDKAQCLACPPSQQDMIIDSNSSPNSLRFFLSFKGHWDPSPWRAALKILYVIRLIIILVGNVRLTLKKRLKYS
jgi:hypothetical protein